MQTTERAATAADALHTPPQDRTPEALQPVQNGLCRLSEVSDARMTDEEREAAIVRAGAAVEHHMADRQKHLLEYDITNNLADKGAADRSRLMAEEAARLMAALIRGRSPQQVARMEREKGLG